MLSYLLRGSFDYAPFDSLRSLRTLHSGWTALLV